MESPPIAKPRTKFRSASSRDSTTKSVLSKGAPTALETKSICALKFSLPCYRSCENIKFYPLVFTKSHLFVSSKNMRFNREPCLLRLLLCFPHSWQCLVVAMMLLALPARAQQTAETDTASQPTAQAPVPLADVLTESESVSASIRDIRTELTADRSAALIAER